jgi:hypothetical protein
LSPISAPVASASPGLQRVDVIFTISAIFNDVHYVGVGVPFRWDFDLVFLEGEITDPGRTERKARTKVNKLILCRISRDQRGWSCRARHRTGGVLEGRDICGGRAEWRCSEWEGGELTT